MERIKLDQCLKQQINVYSSCSIKNSSPSHPHLCKLTLEDRKLSEGKVFELGIYVRIFREHSKDVILMLEVKCESLSVVSNSL